MSECLGTASLTPLANRMTRTFAKKLAPVGFKMPHQFATFHARARLVFTA